MTEAGSAESDASDVSTAGRRPVERDRPHMPHFDLPECLLIKPVRLWLHGPENWTLVGIQYRAHFGEQAGGVGLLALRGLIETINAGARRTMHFRKAWSCFVTGDERALVALAAAVQANDWARARAMAERLVSAQWQGPLIKEAETLMNVFTLKGHRLVNLPPRGKPRPSLSPVAREWQTVVNDLLIDAGD